MSELAATILSLLEGQPDPVWIKVHFGRTKKVKSYIRPELFEPVQARRPFRFIDTNTLYGGERHDSARHLQVAAKHGFAPAVILADEGTLALPGTVVNVAHVTGHKLMGLGGCIKNIGMGLATAAEKRWCHGAAPGSDRIPAGKREQQAYRLGYLAALIEQRCNVVHVALADEVTRNCDCMGDTRSREVLWKGLEVFKGDTSKAVDEVIWNQLKHVLGAVHRPSLVAAQFAGYDAAPREAAGGR